MIYYSQLGKDRIIVEFFGDRVGSVLDIGANDGATLSNSLALVESGWGGVMVEASPVAFGKLAARYCGNPGVHCLNMCVSDRRERFKFYRNITHLNRDDSDLLSTIVESNFRRFESKNQFEMSEIDSVTFDDMLGASPIKRFECVSIDVEGMDLQVLKQMDLGRLGTELLVIEHNGTRSMKEEVMAHCCRFGLTRLLLDNGLNLIITV